MFIVRELQTAFGLDISDLSLRLFLLKKQKEVFKTLAYGEKILPPGLIVDGEIKKPNLVSKTLKELIKKPTFGHVLNQAVIACLPEPKTFIKIIQTPWSKESNLTETIEEGVKKHIPLSLDEAYLDWQISEIKENEWLEMLIGVAPRQIVDSYTDLLKNSGLMPIALEIEAAAINRSLFKQGLIPEKSGIIIDLGATRTSLIIHARAMILFTISVAISGEQLTQTIAQKTGLPPKQAEKLKITYGLNLGVKNKAARQAILPIINNLIKRLKETIDFFQIHFPNQPPIQEITLCGGGANLIGLTQFLSKNLSLKVKLANPLINLITPPKIKSPLVYTTAIGLAIRGCQSERFYDYT